MVSRLLASGLALAYLSQAAAQDLPKLRQVRAVTLADHGNSRGCALSFVGTWQNNAIEMGAVRGEMAVVKGELARPVQGRGQLVNLLSLTATRSGEPAKIGYAWLDNPQYPQIDTKAFLATERDPRTFAAGRRPVSLPEAIMVLAAGTFGFTLHLQFGEDLDVTDVLFPAVPDGELPSLVGCMKNLNAP